MCGLALIFDKQKNGSSKSIKLLINSISHRGPDSKGFYKYKNIALGSCRLSIFDLSTKGNMPMLDKSKRYVIVYNGEIYNFKYLKKKYNILTNSSSDTELLIELFALRGKKFVNDLNGIFSIIIFDKKKNLIFCVRDRLGIKPLYYYLEKNKLIISSEIKAFQKLVKLKLNQNTLNDYLKTSFYEIGKYTFFDNVYQLEQGQIMEYNVKKKNVKFLKYWKLKDKNIQTLNEKNLYQNLNKKILDSFKGQIQTDTELGINVSSGIDSKLMMLCLDRINEGQKNIVANSYYFDDTEFSEKKELEKFAKKINWHVNFYKITPKDIINNFDRAFDNQDEPFPGIITIAKDLLIHRAYKKKVKVILEGQGGDDFAGGYKYIQPYFIKYLFKKFNYIKAIKEILLFTIKENMSLIEYKNFFINSLSGFYSGRVSADGTKNYHKDLFKKKIIKNKRTNLISIFNKLKNIKNPLKSIIYRDLLYTKLPRILRSCDRSSMAYNKELRVPLLDHNIVEFFFKLNSENIIKNGNLRYFYRNYFNIYFNKFNKDLGLIKKRYVSDPQTKWLKKQLYNWALKKFNSKNFKKMNIYDQKKFICKFKEFKRNKKNNNSNFFWQAICVLKLYEKYNLFEIR